MEIKKNKKYQSEQYRLPALFVGFNYVTAIVLLVFTYRTPVYSKEKEENLDLISTNIIYEEVLIEEPQVIIPTPPTQRPEPQQEIDLNQEIEVIENTNEVVNETVVEIIDIVETTEIVEVYEPIIDFPDVEASFNGGYLEMAKWMQENLKYPELSMELNEKGKVYLKFIVEKDGSITNVEIVRGISKELDNEAKRLVRNMPNWTPGEVKGIKVRSIFTMPINFELN